MFIVGKHTSKEHKSKISKYKENRKWITANQIEYIATNPSPVDEGI